METPADDVFADPAALLPDLLAISLTAVNLLRPVFGPDGSELVDFAVEYLNPAAQRITGLPERPVGISTRGRFPDIFANGVFDFYRQVFATGQPGRYDFNYQADGFDNYFQVAAARSGPLLVVSFTDTADHARTPVELALRASQAAERAARAEAEARRQQLEDLLLQAPAPILSLTGPAHTIVLANPLYQQLFGQRPLVGKTIRQALPELAGQPYFGYLDAVYRTGETFYGNELPVRFDRTGTGELEVGYFNFINQATRDAAGAVSGVLVFAFDVSAQVLARQQMETLNQELEAGVAERTRQVRALNAELAVTNQLLRGRNEELSAVNQQLTRTNADLDSFIYIASHDLKEPIANIEGLLLALRRHLPASKLPADEPVEGSVPHLLALMQQDVERFQRTIHQLTDLTRLQQTHAAPAEAVNIAATLAAVRQDLVPLLAGAQLTAEVPADLGMPLPAQQLRSLLYNLLSNALKYRHPDRPALVQLHAYEAAGGVVLEVRDNGLGLDKAQQGQLFGLFKRLHSHVEGAGIGLFLAKRLVEKAGGTITVRSQAGLGTVFTVTFAAVGA